MGDRNGYNNPAFCNHMDLYDYQYVPEIDPDSPDIGSRRSYLVNRQVPPRWDSQLNNKQQHPNKQQNNNRVVVQCNSSSDDSNGSIIIEERNNRRVTLICEKRPKVMRDEDGGYVHDISIESMEGDDNRPSIVMSVSSSPPKNKYKYPKSEDRREVKRPQRQYERNRYEEISDDEEPKYQRSHRYAQIDEHLQTEGVHLTRRKPRAPTPENNRSSTPRSSPFSSNFVNSPNHFNDTNFRITSSPIDCSNSFEMSDFSPPRNTIQRQPPVGASESYVAEPIEQSFIQRTKSEKIMRSPYKNISENNVLMSPRNSKKQIVRSNSKVIERDGHKQSARRNISASFDTQPRNNSPYKPTTRALSPRSTAVVTPILSRKFAELPDEKFEKVSRMFQSTLNVTKNEKNYNEYQQNNLNILPDREGQIKRNKSVPNFDSYHEKSSFVDKKNWRIVERRNDSDRFDTNSPMKSPENFSPMNKSRISLLDTVRSFSSYDEEWTPRTSPCLILSAVIQLIAGIVAGIVCFYLLSKLGRRYFLDLGVIASFISMVLGGLGFRSHRWKWLPNRNYLSGYFMLGVFSVLNAVSLVMIVTIRPMAGDPIMDICAGAICAVSTIIIGVSLIGLTMSGCCKTPPPDNRVTSA